MIIYKVASNSKIEFIPNKDELNLDLLTYLRKLKKLPIASSCNGVGVCKKCVCNTDQLLCKILVKDSPKQIKIDYL